MILELLQKLVGKLESLDSGSMFLFTKWYEYKYKDSDLEGLPAEDINNCIKVAEKLGAL
jgi:hypothetical protein